MKAKRTKRKAPRKQRGMLQLGDLTLNAFHNFYYDNWRKTWGNTFYRGIQTYKLPLDLWIYQELIYKTKPDVIIESGTYRGGSALYLADLCASMKRGLVVTIDNLSYGQKIDRQIVGNNRIKFIRGSSVLPKTIAAVKKLIGPKDRVMVILDSNHKKKHVLQELVAYGKLVTKGSYMILEDTNINGHPVYPTFGPGPMEALEEFMKRNKNFISDKRAEKFFLTFNPRGYLLKVK